MVKRKADTDTIATKHTDKKANKGSTSSTVNANKPVRADQIGLKLNDFQKTAPHLNFSLSEKKTGQEAEEVLKMQLVKGKMSTGSYGWTGAGRRIAVEVEVDGKRQLVHAQVTVNVTIEGSKRAEEGAADEAA